jgi:hypothetical protein
MSETAPNGNVAEGHISIDHPLKELRDDRLPLLSLLKTAD